MIRRLIFLVGALALASAPVLACIHLPKDYAGSVEQSSQGGVIFWNKGREELVLKPSLRFAPPAGAPSDGNLPSEIAWVIPLPSVPDACALVATRSAARANTAVAMRATRP